MTPERARIVTEFLLANMKAEVPITTGVLGAVPVDGLDYRPDSLSRSALELVRHITIEDEWFLNAVAEGGFGPLCDESNACGIMTAADAVAQYQSRIPAALKKIDGLPGDELARRISMFGAIEMPAVGFLSLAMRHTAHHRGQLSAYLRAMGAKVPAIYGPSADMTVGA